MATTRSQSSKEEPSESMPPQIDSEGKPSSDSKKPTIEELLGPVEPVRDQSDKVVQSLVESGNAPEIFDGLSPAYQHLLFDVLWKDFDRLRKLETHKGMPTADRDLTSHYAIRTRDIRYDGNRTGFGDYEEGTVYEGTGDDSDHIAEKRYVEDKKTGKVDVLNADGYMVKEYFRRRWFYDRNEAKKVDAEERPGPKICWGSNLFKVRGGSDLIPETRDGGLLMGGYEPVWISSHISSQLLLYRLTAIFGMPPATDELDDYKQIWSAKLYWSDDRDSYIELYDYKGSASLQFEGCEDASKSALKLVEFLLSDNVPHPYDSTLAGNVA